MLLRNASVQRLLGGGVLERFGIGILSIWEYLALSSHKDTKVINQIFRLKTQRKSLVTFNEAYIVYCLARAQCSMAGELAEVGVYEGSTARLLCELKGNRSLHLFDTFQGLPAGTTETEKRVYGNKPPLFKCSLDSVKDYLKDFNDVHYYCGYFPQSAANLDPSLKFSFVHLDVDLYESTLNSLKFFYDRMQPGGIMLSHDYSILEGVRMAFHEFLKDKPEGLIELPTTQAMIVKR